MHLCLKLSVRNIEVHNYTLPIKYICSFWLQKDISLLLSLFSFLFFILWCSVTTLQLFVNHFDSPGLVKYVSTPGICIPDSKVHGANMGPTWVLSASGGPHVVPMNLAIRACKGMVVNCSLIAPGLLRMLACFACCLIPKKKCWCWNCSLCWVYNWYMLVFLWVWIFSLHQHNYW